MTTKEEQIIITKYDLLYEQRMTRVESACEDLRETSREIKNELSEIRKDMKNELSEIRKDMKTDFRWLLFTMGVMFAVMAHGFKWF